MAPVDLDLWIFLLRLALVGLLYLFLLQVVLALRRELRQRADRPAPAVPVAGRLAVVESDLPDLIAGETIDLLPSTTIGRDGPNTIRINDSFVSSVHAVLSFRNKRWWIEDAGSTNGTFVNRRQVQGPATLEPGDIVEIGRVKFKLMR